MGAVIGIITSLVITAALIGIPTWLVLKVVKKVDKKIIIYSPEEVTQMLRKGFFLSIWGIELMFGVVLSFVLIFFDIYSFIKFVIPCLFVIGVIMFFIGRIQVGTTTRYLNICNRDRTELEDLVLNIMKAIEGTAKKVNSINAITKLTPGVTDDILVTLNSKDIINGFWAVASIYTGKNNLKKHWPIISIVILIFILILFTIIK